jgi:hypothetical protein
MGDLINCGLTVYACPPAEVRHFLDVIEDWGLYGAAATTGRSIELGAVYRNVDATTTGAAFDIAARLQRDARGSTWEVWQGVTRDGEPGAIFPYAPGLGTWAGNCDDAGDPAVTSAKIREAFEKYRTDEGRLGAIERAIGQQWAEAFAALPAGARVAVPKVYGVTWDRRAGEISVEDPDDGAEVAVLKDAPVGLTRMGLEALRGEANAFLAAREWTVSEQWAGAASGRIQCTNAYYTPAESPAGGAA